jgi:spore germination protein KC
MNRSMKISFCILLFLFCTGCWDALELSERGFIMGIAVDQTEDKGIMITTQIHKPTPKGGQSQPGGENESINVRTFGDSFIEAMRDIPIHIGSKAQLSHTNSIIISEELARNQNIGEILELFYRDHEARITTTIMITKGKAANYLEKKPIRENTMGQQLYSNAKGSADISNKSMDMDLLKLALQMKSEVGNSFVPYVYIQSHGKKSSASVAGVVLLKKGIMLDAFPASKMEYLRILSNEYRNGMISIPCKKQPKKTEVVEIVSLKTSLKPVIQNNTLNVFTSVNIEAVIQELNCSKTDEQENEKKFVQYLEQNIKKQLKDTISLLQMKKFDAIGLGNKIYAKDPALWKKWKKDWDEKFKDSHFIFDVKARITNSGTNIGRPTFSK